MGIDRIGKSGPPAVSPETPPEASRAGKTGQPFAVPGSAQATPSPAVQTTEGPLAAYRAGALDVDGYLDQKVDEATAHLTGLPAAQLVSLRAALRDRLASDPTLVGLVQTATGAVPKLPDDE